MCLPYRKEDGNLDVMIKRGIYASSIMVYMDRSDFNHFPPFALHDI